MKTILGLWAILLCSLLANPFAGHAATIDVRSLIETLHPASAPHDVIGDGHIQPSSSVPPILDRGVPSLHSLRPLLAAASSTGGILSLLMSVTHHEIDGELQADVLVEARADEPVTTVPVPVPAAAWLFGGGLTALAGFIRRRKRASSAERPPTKRTQARHERWEGAVRIQFKSAHQRIIGTRRDDPHGCFVAFDDS